MSRTSPKTPKLSHADLLRVLHYDPETGVFTWKERISIRIMVGWRAGMVNTIGYRVTQISGEMFLMHRLAWFYVHGRWPVADIDHINGDRDDNRLCNLREATRQQNIQNSKRRRDNRTGIKGVSWVESRGHWLASVKCPDGSHIKKTFDCKHKAAAFYREAATREFQEFARTE
jgi:hypothetical protein